MWESIYLTLMATAGNNIGKALQKKGTVVLPPLSLRPNVLKAYLLNKSWVIGFLMDILGATLMLKALSLAPVSIIQPVSGCGLAILALFSHFYLREAMNALDWIGIVLAGIGTIGVGVGGEEQSLPSVSLLRLPWLVFSISILFILLNAWLRIFKSKRRDQELRNHEVVAEIKSGLESGILFGLLIIFGIILLVCSAQIMSLLPRRPLRRLRSSKVRSHNLKRSPSLRPKDTSPNTVIHASNLHHLMASPAVKEKP